MTANVELVQQDDSRRRGRPYAITPEVEETLLTALGDGQPISVACGLAGIRTSTYYAHCNRLPEFKEKATHARAKGLVELDKTVFEAVKAEAACGNAHSLVAYYKMRLGMWRADEDEGDRREREAERAEELSGNDNTEVIGLIVAAVKRELGRGGGTDQRLPDGGRSEPLHPGPADS